MKTIKTLFTSLLLLIASSMFAETLSLPLDFETGTYTWTDFNGGVMTVVDNSQNSGINTSAKVAQMVKGAGDVWGGSWLALDAPIDFSTKKLIKVKVYSPRVGAKMLFKMENMTDGGINTEKELTTTVANAWEELTFDFSDINTAQSYQKIVIIFDNGTTGDGSANFTFLVDDIMQAEADNGGGDTGEEETTAPSLPMDFESGEFVWTDFDGGVMTVVDNSQNSGINTSTKVAQMVKNANQVWGGSWIALDAPIDFSTKKLIKVKVYSPRVGVKMLFKIENMSDGGINSEKELTTTVANAWEELTFDFSDINTAQSYQKIVIIFDNGTMGDGSANFTFLVDDIMQAESEASALAQIDLPLNFEDTTINYQVTDFGSNATVIGEDPTDASNTIAMTTKTNGAATWAGTTIGTALGFATVVPLSVTNSKISVRVYSPKAGIQVRLKGESHNDVTLTVETEATVTSANTWETLVFDFNNVATGTNPFNPATAFDKFSIFFDFGQEGDASVYYWDDVVFGSDEASLSPISESNIKMFTSNGTLQINGLNDYTNGRVQIYNIAGKSIHNSIITNNNESYSLSEKGIYIVHLSNSNNQDARSQKVVIF